MTQLVFLPATVDEAMAVRAGTDLGVRTGCSATISLARAVGAEAATEEIEYAALSYAGDLARTLSAGSHRLVLAVDADDDQLTDRQTDTGEVSVTAVRWAQVQALFADDPADGDSDPDADLLWFATAELDSLGVAD